MENLKITVDGEDYLINQHYEIKGLFYVKHWSGVHKLARRDDGTWHYIEYEPLAHAFNLEKISLEIEKHLK